MDLEAVEKLVDLVASANVREVTVRSGTVRVTVRKCQRPRPSQTAEQRAATHPPAASDERTEQHTQPEPGEFVTSPMVGIYHAAVPAVQVGWSLKVGQVVGAIESMKLLSDVRADRAGVVKAVLIDQGMAVEFGQPLLELDSGSED